VAGSRTTIEIAAVDHIGVRVHDLDRAMKFYAVLGFTLEHKATNDAVAVVRNAEGVELNLVYNANADAGGNNILMDVREKYPGYTHVALRVRSIRSTIEVLRTHGVRITQGPVSFGRDGHVSVFVRDPDLNVIELRGRDEDLSSIGGVVEYVPEN
jgi:lactoylglutathione lyase